MEAAARAGEPQGASNGGALEAVCKRLMTLSQSVGEDPILERYPEVMALQAELIELVLKPISHVLSDFGLLR